jgi:hypothetical protein
MGPAPSLVVLLGLALTAPASAQVRAPAAADPGLDSARAALASVEQAVTQIDGALSPMKSAKGGGADSAHTAWLRDVRGRLDAFAGQLRQATVVSPRDRPTGQASGQRYHEWRWRTALRELQDAIITESGRFQTLSNASKTRHDLAMNAIRNMK